MVSFCRYGGELRLLAVLTVAISATYAQTLPTSGTCAVSAVPNLVRAEGLTERMGDILLQCSGSNPGSVLSGNLSVFLPVNDHQPGRLQQPGSGRPARRGLRRRIRAHRHLRPGRESGDHLPGPQLHRSRHRPAQPANLEHPRRGLPDGDLRAATDRSPDFVQPAALDPYRPIRDGRRILPTGPLRHLLRPGEYYLRRLSGARHAEPLQPVHHRHRVCLHAPHGRIRQRLPAALRKR